MWSESASTRRRLAAEDLRSPVGIRLSTSGLQRCTPVGGEPWGVFRTHRGSGKGGEGDQEGEKNERVISLTHCGASPRLQLESCQALEGAAARCGNRGVVEPQEADEPREEQSLILVRFGANQLTSRLKITSSLNLTFSFDFFWRSGRTDTCYFPCLPICQGLESHQ